MPAGEGTAAVPIAATTTLTIQFMTDSFCAAIAANFESFAVRRVDLRLRGRRLIHVKPLRPCILDNATMDRTGTFMGVLRRKRTELAALCLAVWLFSFAVGVAHACGVLPVDDERAAASFALRASAEPTESSGDGGCAKFCADDMPLIAKLTAVQDHPSGQALLPALLSKPLLIAVAPAAFLSHRPHPPPGIALNTRFVRLAL